MKTIFFLILAISMLVGLSWAEETTTVSDEEVTTTVLPLAVSEEEAKKIYREIIGDVNSLIRKFNNLTKQFKKRKLNVPKPVPDPIGFINDLSGIKSLRKSLNESENTVRSKKCLYILNTRIQMYADGLDWEVEDDFNGLMSELRHKLSRSRRRFGGVANDLRRNQLAHRRNCEIDRRNCDATREERDEVREELETLEITLANIEQSFKDDYEVWTEMETYDHIIPAVEDCMSDDE